MANLLITGASRGLGAAFSAGLPQPGDNVWLVSRTAPLTLQRNDGAARTWIQADLSSPAAASQRIADSIGTRPLDALICNAGIWEANAFGDGYDFASVSARETEEIIAVNLTAAVLCAQKLLPNIKQSPIGKIIFIGSTSGLENGGYPEVAYVASKFGLRGATHALRESLRPHRIAVTCINPGDLAATPYDAGLQAALDENDGEAIPPQDMVAIVKCVLGLSNATCIKEIDVPAMSNLQA